jgi:tRNA-splicing ligase RtcB
METGKQILMIDVKFSKKFNVQTHAYQGEGGKLNVPMMMWLSEVEWDALQQLERAASLPFVFHHVAGMPDMHYGFGVPIGSVIPTKGYIIPNAVGVDIGCGMCCIKTDLTHIDKPVLKSIMGDIRKAVPVGFKHNKKAEGMPPIITMPDLSKSVVAKEWDSATKQLGTLGGGNHFIEIQKGDDGFIYVMIHSGSRNLGKKIADHYNKIAVELNEKWKSSVPKHWDLAFLPFNDDIGQMYYHEMLYALDFAYWNRKVMMKRIKTCITNHIDANFSNLINIHHNYADMENHFGQNVLVHRKGATRAKEGELGLIPGSQGTASYIVRGKGNANSFHSCSHGAGRLMSRRKAKENLDLEQEKKILDDQGIVHSVRNISDLDEASGAYKDIGTVMDHQEDLVEIVTELKPLAVIKG